MEQRKARGSGVIWQMQSQNRKCILSIELRINLSQWITECRVDVPKCPAVYEYCLIYCSTCNTVLFTSNRFRLPDLSAQFIVCAVVQHHIFLSQEKFWSQASQLDHNVKCVAKSFVTCICKSSGNVWDLAYWQQPHAQLCQPYRTRPRCCSVNNMQVPRLS